VVLAGAELRVRAELAVLAADGVPIGSAGTGVVMASGGRGVAVVRESMGATETGGAAACAVEVTDGFVTGLGAEPAGPVVRLMSDGDQPSTCPAVAWRIVSAERWPFAATETKCGPGVRTSDRPVWTTPSTVMTASEGRAPPT
jgi:hypothetical protein